MVKVDRNVQPNTVQHMRSRKQVIRTPGPPCSRIILYLSLTCFVKLTATLPRKHPAVTLQRAQL
jgi:hypothetical protein